MEQSKLGMETIQKAQEVIKETDAGKQRELDWKVKEKRALNEVDVEDIDTAQKSAKGTHRFLQQFARSYEELKKYDSSIGKEGLGGYLRRKGAKIASDFDVLPETQALQIMIEPMANGMARDIEGGRVTDQDRKIYAESFANTLKNPSATNIRLTSQSIVSLIDKGADMIPMLKQLAATDVDIFNDVIKQVGVDFPEATKDIYSNKVDNTSIKLLSKKAERANKIAQENPNLTRQEIIGMVNKEFNK
jgi:hypothetical protein